MVAFRHFKLVVRAMALMMAVLVAAPTSGLGQLLYFCTMTKDVGPRCCCQHEAQQDTIEGPSLTAAPCCEIVSAEEQIPPTRVEVVWPELETPQFVAMPFQPGFRTPVRAPTRLTMPHGPRGPPPDTGPPIFVRYCSYLI